MARRIRGGSGMNRGAKADTLELLGRRLDEIYDGRRGAAGRLEPWRDVRAANWRIATRRRCARVVTLCSPFSGDYKTNTNIREFYERIAGHDVNEPPFPRVDGKPPVPTLAFWSRQGRDRRAERGARAGP